MKYPRARKGSRGAVWGIGKVESKDEAWENECTHGGVDSCPFFTSNPSKNTPASPYFDKFSSYFVTVVKTQKRKRRARLRFPATMPENHEKWPSLDRQRHANKSVSVAALVMGDR